MSDDLWRHQYDAQHLSNQTSLVERIMQRRHKILIFRLYTLQINALNNTA